MHGRVCPAIAFACSQSQALERPSTRHLSPQHGQAHARQCHHRAAFTDQGHVARGPMEGRFSVTGGAWSPSLTPHPSRAAAGERPGPHYVRQQVAPLGHGWGLTDLLSQSSSCQDGNLAWLALTEASCTSRQDSAHRMACCGLQPVPQKSCWSSSCPSGRVGVSPGSTSASTPGHRDLADSQWMQYKMITDFYAW